MKAIRWIFICLLIGIETMSAQPNGYFIKSNDQTAIYVEEMGQGDPIVLLAGGPGLEPDYMLPILQQLATKHRCLLLHQRGTGRSRRDSVLSSIKLNDYIADIEALRQHLKVAQLTLLGHSWGGILGQLYTGQFPARVKQLILLDSGGPSLQFTTFYSDNIRLRLRDEDLQALQKAQQTGDFAQIIHALTPGYFYDRKLGLSFQQVATPPNAQAGLINKALLTQFGAMGGSVATQLTAYKGPVCLIQGRQDPIDEATAYEIKAVLPQTEMHFVERSGHMPWLEAAPAVASFFSFLQQCIP